MKQNRAKKKDLKTRINAIIRADKLTKKSGKQLFVLRVDNSDYRILTKPQIKATMRKMLNLVSINYMQTNEFVVHITRKGNENN